MPKVILDVDTGTDDAVALMFAALHGSGPSVPHNESTFYVAFVQLFCMGPLQRGGLAALFDTFGPGGSGRHARRDDLRKRERAAADREDHPHRWRRVLHCRRLWREYRCRS